MIKCKNGRATFRGRPEALETELASIVDGMSQMLPRDAVFMAFLIGLFRTEIKESARDDEQKHYEEYDKIKQFVDTGDATLAKYIRNTAYKNCGADWHN